MDKHAYLIMAHNDFWTLNQLLFALDDPRNEIFLHIDKKSTFDLTMLRRLEYAKLILAPRIKVEWAGDTQVKCECNLLKLAFSKGYHDYYHLLSGADLPLKAQDEIYEFFQKNKGKNFLSFDDEREVPEFVNARLKEYRFFQNMIGRKRGMIPMCLRVLEKGSLQIQRVLGINRIQSFHGNIFKGAQWFSITHEMAETVLANQEIIEKYFHHALCPDEMFLQTIAMNSPLKDSVVHDNLRCIDWTRGQPYTFTKEDKEMLLSCEKIFARKFSSTVDRDIIKELVSHLKTHCES